MTRGPIPLEPLPAGRADLARAAFQTDLPGGMHDQKGKLELADYASTGNAWGESVCYRAWLPQLLDPSRLHR